MPKGNPEFLKLVQEYRGDMQAAGQRFFSDRQDKDPYHFTLITTVKVRPPQLDVETYGHHRSTGLRQGVRLWAFKLESGRDKAATIFASEVLDA